MSLHAGRMLVSIALAMLGAAVAQGEGKPPDNVTPRSYVGTAICRGCHPVETRHWEATIHGQVFLQRPRNSLQARGCEACHGPGSAHLQDPEDRSLLVSFSRESETAVLEQNRTCLACHASGPRIHWTGSPHEDGDLSCSDCHNPMAQLSPTGLLAKRSVNETCFSCHPQQRVEFRKRSHMPLLEGKITCSDCHNPHGSVSESLVREDTVNQLCTRCHAEKRGPFLWEHAPVGESCLSCHLPHGSNHESLLTVSSPFLCQQCHSQMRSYGHPNDLLTSGNLAGGSQPDVRLLNRGCVNCHVQIHGSNHPSGARFHR